MKINVNIGLRGSGATAFSIASEKSHFAVMKLLIKKGNDGLLNNGWCSDNWTPNIVLCKEATVTESTTSADTIIGLGKTQQSKVEENLSPGHSWLVLSKTKLKHFTFPVVSSTSYTTG